MGFLEKNHLNDEEIMKIVDKIPDDINTLSDLKKFNLKEEQVNIQHLLVCDECIKKVWDAYETKMEMKEFFEEKPLFSLEYILSTSQFLIGRLSSEIKIAKKVPLLNVRSDSEQGYRHIEIKGAAKEIPGLLYKAVFTPDIDGYNVLITFQGKIHSYFLVDIDIDSQNIGASSIMKNKSEMFILANQISPGCRIKIYVKNELEKKMVLDYKNG